ncbi:Uncharacterised protein [Mycobacteroides abscessus subsp. abscessus]|nr:Uncharacterised protein [Mycobacteroides abscessus subsp. abscessus]SKT88858.1 Uncharacterised protein [Mycobacteroides abscessus subsp. abscessus]
MERTGRASRTPSTNRVSRTLADHAARAWSATRDNTTSPHRQPPSHVGPSWTGLTPLSPYVASTCSGGRSTVTRDTLPPAMNWVVFARRSCRQSQVARP